MFHHRQAFGFAKASAVPALLGLSLGLVPALPGAVAHAAPDQSGTAKSAEEIATWAVQTHAAGQQWRQQLLTRLRTLPQWSHDRSVDGPLSGTIVARKLRISANVNVKSDTVIVADWIEFDSASPRIVTNGNDLSLLPVSGVRVSAAGGGAGITANIVIDASSPSPGGTGFRGSEGRLGNAGSDGTDGSLEPNNCNGNIDGSPGGSGESGGSGTAGGPGGAGGHSGGITFDIPPGDPNSYTFLANGAAGGPGGEGGAGASGGNGGRGGDGADMTENCIGFLFRGGGNGGSGGSGGNGGDGGSGVKAVAAATAVPSTSPIPRDTTRTKSRPRPTAAPAVAVAPAAAPSASPASAARAASAAPESA